MKINWKVRFKNKTFLITFVSTLIGFVYNVLGLFDIVPPIAQDTAINMLVVLINTLAMLGIVADPTTKGLDDSERALNYKELG